MPFLDQTQRVFPSLPIIHTADNPDTFILPLLSAFLSIITLFFQFLFDRCRVSRRRVEQDASSFPKSKNDIGFGSNKVLRFMVVRLIGCFVLFSLDVATINDRRGGGGRCSAHESCQLRVALTATYAYVSILVAASLASKAWRTSLVRHNVFVLLSVLAVYIYRNVWPLARYDKTPIDMEEGRLLWAKLAVLTITVILIPLFIPREYVPVDPSDPMEEPNPEQTCCLISTIFYSFLDPIILMASKVNHLSYDKLPPQPDYDRSKNLIKHAFRHVDYYSGAQPRHLALGLLRVFLADYLLAVFALTIQSLLSFSSPFAINRILHYIETGGERATIRPWFWILCLFIGPLLVSLTFQYYLYLTSRIVVHAEALITQLVLEHSLRIRLRGVTSEDKPENTAPVSPDESCEPSQNSPGREPSEDTAVDSDSEPMPKDSSSTKITPSTAVKKDQNLIGKINNLVTTDAVAITDARDFLQVVYVVPLQLTLCMIFLHGVLGWSAFVGLASIILLIPVPGYVASLMQAIQAKKMEMTDARVQTVTEAVNVLRMVKIFGWEAKMREHVIAKREEELDYIWKSKALIAVQKTVNFLIPVVTMLVTFTTHTLIMKQDLSASKVFSSMAVFEMLRTQLRRVVWEIGALVKAKVSLDRLTLFLRETELLDQFSETSKSAPSDDEHERGNIIGFKDAHFTWSSEPEVGAQRPSARSFKLRIEGDLYFKRGKINLIVGPTGSGKTSILMALLGEMHFIPAKPDSWFGLPRQGGIAYAAQESWVQNETIRNNILFGAPFDEIRYNKVIKQCALERDLELFEAGDKTEVGERGLTLSGGQKARVTLARAIYSRAEIILLDDVLAALDVHTSKWIVNNCLRGDLIRGRTVLLVTHDVSLATSIAGFLVTVCSNGQVYGSEDATPTVTENDSASAVEVKHDADQVVSETQLEGFHPPKGCSTAGKLVIAEEVAHGHVSWKALKLFLGALGGNHVPLFFSIWIGGTFVVQYMNIFSMWFLGYWGSQYEIHRGAEVRVSYYLSVYSAILVAQVTINVLSFIVYILGTVRASRVINMRLLDSILGSTLRWLDETPTSRIITRCTQDIASVDGTLPWMFIALVETTTNLLTNLGGIIFFSPIFVFPGLSIGIIGLSMGHIYLKAQLSLKREMSNAKAPVLGHFGAAIAGLTSIRAYDAQQSFKLESQKRIDHLVRLSMVSYNVNRWISVRIDVLGAIFTSSLAIYLVYYGSINAANTGFSLTMAVEFCSLMLWSVRMYNMFEVQANSLERALAYIQVEQEPKPTEEGKPPAAWPTSGELLVENLSARYSKTGPAVLHGLSFHIKSGERVGIVGRTGSGKSSLALSLLRCIITEGEVQYDNISTATINLDALRSNITIIPQMPELLSGTLRRNIDPFEQHGDVTLNDALRSAGLFSLQDSIDEARLTLDSNIATGGGNISVGQRQIIALARAILRGSKLLILDEATSSIDHKTDTVIQTTLRNKLASDVTVLTIAHRLQTIMDADKILVLDNGRIVEFDAPDELLKKEGSLFKSLVDESGDKGALYTMAGLKAAPPHQVSLVSGSPLL